MTLSTKLQLRADQSIVVLGPPDGLQLDLPISAGSVVAILAFVTNAHELDTVAAPVLEAAREDWLAWIAYPKAKQLGTDLNRDVLAALAKERGIQPVRQVSIDAVWSALRFRPLDTTVG